MHPTEFDPESEDKMPETVEDLTFLVEQLTEENEALIREQTELQAQRDRLRWYMANIKANSGHRRSCERCQYAYQTLRQALAEPMEGER